MSFLLVLLYLADDKQFIPVQFFEICSENQEKLEDIFHVFGRTEFMSDFGSKLEERKLTELCGFVILHREKLYDEQTEVLLEDTKLVPLPSSTSVPVSKGILKDSDTIITVYTAMGEGQEGCSPTQVCSPAQGGGHTSGYSHKRD